MSATVEYVAWQPGTPLPTGVAASKCKAFVLVESAPSPGEIAEAAALLVSIGAMYVCAWGENCSAWDDAVDIAALLHYGFEDDSPLVMTTWHSDDTLDEALRFFKVHAREAKHHPGGCDFVGFDRAIILHVATEHREAEIVSRLGTA